jgi:hypothetical protein
LRHRPGVGYLPASMSARPSAQVEAFFAAHGRHDRVDSAAEGLPDRTLRIVVSCSCGATLTLDLPPEWRDLDALRRAFSPN